MNDLERRLIVVEEGFNRMSEDLKMLLTEAKALRVDVAEVKGRVNSLPTTLQLLLCAVAIFGAAGLTRVFGH